MIFSANRSTFKSTAPLWGECGVSSIEYTLFIGALLSVFVLGSMAMKQRVEQRFERGAAIEANYVPCSADGLLQGEECL